MIENIKVEGGRLHNDGPTPRIITNYGPDDLYIGDEDVSAADYDHKVAVDKDVTVDGEKYLYSTGRSRVSIARQDPADVQFLELERRVSVLEAKVSKKSPVSRKSAK